MTDPAQWSTVLVVDDHVGNRELLAGYVAGLHCQVQQAEDGETALAAVAAAPPDLILLDVMMPGLNGFAVTRRLKADPATALIPIVLITALDDPASRLEGLQAGAEEFLTKPVDRAELVARVRSLLQLKRLRDTREADTMSRLASSEERFQSLVEGLHAIVWEADTATLRFTFVNQRAETLLGYPVDRWLRQRDFWEVFLRPADREQTLAALRAAADQGQAHEFECRAVAADGRILWLHALVRGAHDADRQQHSLRGLMVDVTARVEAEQAHARLSEELRARDEQLRQFQKMEAIGRLAGGIAHDFNNLLMAISGFNDLVETSLGPGDPALDYTAEIDRAVESAATLTRQLLAFGRRQVLSPRVVSLNAVVAEMEQMLRRLIGEDVELVLRLDSMGHVKADPGQLQQVILNLAVNARDAMPQGGQLTIELADAELADTSEHLPGVVLPGSYVTLAITDTGSGMDAETQSHLFEPFFTTKELGKGTGLGLATVYGIVKQSNGSILVSSAVGQGTTLKVLLPRVDAPRTVADTRPAPPPPAGRRATILVVEDEPQIRDLLCRILQSQGHTTLPAADGPAALAIAAEHDGPIDLLLTDVVMPGLSGHEVALQARQLRPGLAVLYMSGYPGEAVTRYGVLESGVNFLQKPFTPGLLSEKVSQVLDARSAAPDADAARHNRAAAPPRPPTADGDATEPTRVTVP